MQFRTNYHSAVPLSSRFEIPVIRTDNLGRAVYGVIVESVFFGYSGITIVDSSFLIVQRPWPGLRV